MTSKLFSRIILLVSSWGRSSPGRALEWHSRGSRFDPDRLHQKSLNTSCVQTFLFLNAQYFCFRVETLLYSYYCRGYAIHRHNAAAFLLFSSTLKKAPVLFLLHSLTRMPKCTGYFVVLFQYFEIYPPFLITEYSLSPDAKRISPFTFYKIRSTNLKKTVFLYADLARDTLPPCLIGKRFYNKKAAFLLVQLKCTAVGKSILPN